MDSEIIIEGGLNSTVSVIFYVLQWLLLFPTLYVNSLVFLMARRESLSISLELMVVSAIYIVVSVCSVLYQGMIKFLFPVSHWIGDWFCETSNVFMSAVMFQQLLYTFTISVYRYVFIIYVLIYVYNICFYVCRDVPTIIFYLHHLCV